jgi:hypothetical protein
VRGPCRIQCRSQGPLLVAKPSFHDLSRIPDFVPLFGTLLGGIRWITHRRQNVAEAEANQKPQKGGGR